MNADQRMWATLRFEPLDHLYRREFYIWEEALHRWRDEGMPADADINELFGFDQPGTSPIQMLGWCSPPFCPALAEEVIEETADYQVVRDGAGRLVKLFKGRRHGFMPTYLKHAVTNDRDWEEEVLPLLDPATPQRWDNLATTIERVKAERAAGKVVELHAIGGYMYLRALVGPEEICFLCHDNPALVHKMMRAWLELADAVSRRFQQHVPIDQLFLAEDICYNHGLLISPRMVRELIFPYYAELQQRIRGRQPGVKLYFHVDTDGNCAEAIDLYREVGMTMMSPFEVAAGNDVRTIAERYPDLVISGGIDKRVLAEGQDAIEAHLQALIPFMVQRGGFIPTCDHGVPDNVAYQDYLYYRHRMLELDH